MVSGHLPRALYRHTQVGYAMFAVAGILLAAIALRTAANGVGPLVAVGGVLVVLLLVAPTLTVEVTTDAIHCRFGAGPFTKRIPLDQVVDARRVRNNPLYGWGQRITPHGWLWNVSGLDAVELQLRRGRSFRIGTDDPDGLLSAVKTALAQHGPAGDDAGAAPRTSGRL